MLKSIENTIKNCTPNMYNHRDKEKEFLYSYYNKEMAIKRFLFFYSCVSHRVKLHQEKQQVTLSKVPLHCFKKFRFIHVLSMHLFNIFLQSPLMFHVLTISSLID